MPERPGQSLRLLVQDPPERMERQAPVQPVRPVRQVQPVLQVQPMLRQAGLLREGRLEPGTRPERGRAADGRKHRPPFLVRGVRLPGMHAIPARKAR